jgi:hypothetical protein
MKKHTGDMKNEHLHKAIDRLTEENQCYVLGVLQALTFAQNTQNQAKQISAISEGKQCADQV